ncbi:MAG: histidine--tRNA ligase [Candidatus Omnitrophota bacterium]|jgi:histidyl-tRNA synthetase|nr:MAG: histidine--tRNA ligase [Candidatus Omnitrophota bacterium]
MFKRVAGTKDILPAQVSLWQSLEAISREVFNLYNYKEMRPPLLEDSSLFNRSLGETAEIVQKQMFLVKKGDDEFALRPEATASIVRAYIENSLDKQQPFSKLYYIGPMFRLERPQKGRFRQFHHIGCEAIGSKDPYVDVEVISLANTLLTRFFIDGYTLHLNSLGCPQDKKKFSDLLRAALKGKVGRFCEECRARYERNVFRILDCKNESCRALVKDLGLKNEHLCKECAQHFELVKKGLGALGVKYEVSHLLVRGLDYYTGTVFEFKHKSLESQQDALGAGGRYDTLTQELGGPDKGACGFAFGIERLLLVCKEEKVIPAPKPLVFLILLGDRAREEGFKILNNLRNHGIAADTDYESKSLKGAMRKANDFNARFVAILGEDELSKETISLKDMQSGQQKEVKIEQMIQEIGAIYQVK